MQESAGEARTSFLYKFVGCFLALLCLFPLSYYYLKLFMPAMGDGPLFFAYRSKIGAITVPVTYALISFIISSIWKQWESRNLDDKVRVINYILFTFLRLSLGYIMFWYAAIKIFDKQFFVRFRALDTPMGDVDSFYLTWYFFGRSNWEVLLTAVLELIPSVMLLFRRTALLGALSMLPVLMNVLITNIFNNISYGTLRTSAILFFVTIYIIASDKDKIKLVMGKLLELTNNTVATNKTINRLSKGGNIFFGFIIACFIVTSTYKAVIRHNRKAIYGGFQIKEFKTGPTVQNLDSTKLNYIKKIYFERASANTLFDKANHELNFIPVFAQNSDSLRIKPSGENRSAIDALYFKGTYCYNDKDSLLVIKGVQGENIVEATYKKLPLDDYAWWW